MQQRRLRILGILVALYLQDGLPQTVAQSTAADEFADFALPAFFRGWTWGTPLAEILAKEGNHGILNKATPDAVELELIYKNQIVLGHPALVVYRSGPCAPQTPAACSLTRVEIWWRSGLYGDFMETQDKRPLAESLPEREAILTQVLGPGERRGPGPGSTERVINGTHISHGPALVYRSPRNVELLDLHHALINSGVDWRTALRRAFSEVYGFSSE